MEINLKNDEIMGTDSSFMKRRKNGLMLSDNDIKILERNNIDYLLFNNLKDLLFQIEVALEENDDIELDELSIKLGEYNYYNYTNK